MCFESLCESSHRDGSFEYTQHVICGQIGKVSIDNSGAGSDKNRALPDTSIKL